MDRFVLNVKNLRFGLNTIGIGKTSRGIGLNASYAGRVKAKDGGNVIQIMPLNTAARGVRTIQKVQTAKSQPASSP